MQKYSFFYPWGPSSSRSFLKSRLNFVKYCFFFEPFSGYEPHLTKKLEISGWSVRFYRILIWQIVFCGLFLCLWGSRFGGQRCSYNNFSSYFKSRLVIQNYYFHHIFNNKQRHSFIHFFFGFTLNACNLNQVEFTLAKKKGEFIICKGIKIG
jgi:hypothetical protein